MALDKFQPAPLPNPPPIWDATWARQMIRVLEVYFSQLESDTPNHAEKYTAVSYVTTGYTTADKLLLTGVREGTIIYDKTLKKLCLYNGATWETVTSA